MLVKRVVDAYSVETSTFFLGEDRNKLLKLQTHLFHSSFLHLISFVALKARATHLDTPVAIVLKAGLRCSDYRSKLAHFEAQKYFLS
jgi:hypothetical protein